MYLGKILQTYFMTLFTFRPDVVIFTNPSYISFFSIDFLRILKTKVVIRIGADLKYDFDAVISNINSLSPKKIIKKIQHKMFSYSVKKSDKLLTTSKYVKQQLAQSYSIPLSKMDCIYTPVKPQKNISIKKKEDIILSVTQFNNPLKTQGAQETIENLSGWLKANPSYRYTIVGAGKYFGAIKKWKKENHDLPNISFTGYIKNVEDWYLKSKVFIHISYSDGFPIVVLEAQAYGLPVIANNDVGMKEQVVHNHNGFLIDNGELHTIAKYLNMLLQDEKKYVNFSDNCTDYVSKNYNLDIVSKRINDALKFN